MSEYDRGFTDGALFAALIVALAAVVIVLVQVTTA